MCSFISCRSRLRRLRNGTCRKIVIGVVRQVEHQVVNVRSRGSIEGVLQRLEIGPALSGLDHDLAIDPAVRKLQRGDRLRQCLSLDVQSWPRRVNSLTSLPSTRASTR